MIKNIRQQLGISQLELGAAIGKSQGMIAHYETGRYLMDATTAKTIINLCKKKGLVVDYNMIYGDREAETKNEGINKKKVVELSLKKYLEENEKETEK